MIYLIKKYIGFSAGSEILGNSIDTALSYDENNVGMKDFNGLSIIDGLVIPQSNRKEKNKEEVKEKSNYNIILLYDGDGIII